jgi:hypothetical protein
VTGPRYPEIAVSTEGFEGNRLAVLGLVLGAMNSAGLPRGQVDEFLMEVNRRPETYADLLAVCGLWVTVRRPPRA